MTGTHALPRDPATPEQHAPTARDVAAVRGDYPAPPWPARELDGTWDSGLQVWRYRRILRAIDEQAGPDRMGYSQRCCTCPASPPGERATERRVLIAVPVPPGWAPAPGQTTIAAYECSGELLSGTASDGLTVLALFPPDKLRDAIRARLKRVRGTKRAARAVSLEAIRPRSARSAPGLHDVPPPAPAGLAA